MKSLDRKGIDFGSVKDSVDLVSIAQGYTQLKGKGRDLSGPCPFCGGEDRFYFHRDGQHCGCRKCGFQGDVIDLVSKADGISKAEAARKLSGGDLPCPTPRARRVIKSPVKTPGIESKTPNKSPVDLALQTGWTEIVNRAEKSLEGSAAHRYLEDDRGLDMSTARRFRLGSGSFMGRPVLVIPIIGEGGVIEAVKYRFVDQLAQDQKGKRFAQEKGSRPGLFGGHCLNGLPFLVIVEGELNAASIAQAVEGEGDVLSIGSQSGNILQAVEIAKRYSKVVVWFDEGEKAAEAKKHIRKAIPFKSPVIGSCPLDANDILKVRGVEMLKALMLSIVGPVRSEHPPEVVTPASTPNVGARNTGGIKIGEGAPPIPPHIRPFVRVWTREIAESWAWAECVNPKSPYRLRSTTGTVGGAIASMIEQWESL